MKAFRWLGWPLAIVYASVMTLRNWMFDWGIFTSMPLPKNTIGVGNLSVGGTGKSVVVNYLIQESKSLGKTAVLSRGYGRKTRGYILADSSATATTIGDEPFQFWKRHPDIWVAVAEKRRIGIEKLVELQSPPSYIILDDVFQHRWVRPQKMVLCTRFDALYSHDYVFPMGRLRESTQGKKRADICLVTNCPADLEAAKRLEIAQQLQWKDSKTLIFTTITYADQLLGRSVMAPEELKKEPLVVVTGFAKPERFLNFLRSQGFEFTSFCYPDHHNFKPQEIQQIEQAAQGGNILTTEKDYGRLGPQINSENLYYWPIELEFLSPQDKGLFDQNIWG